MTTVVRLENVSKQFLLNLERHRSFQDIFVHRFKRKGTQSIFWALRDVSFELAQGESIGIIGPNGSGKSTTLKLISRIIHPTSGRITVSGRLSALLELGAGFHPDLTGRENIYLNGSLLGLNRRQMARKLDEIVSFANLGQFIDIPVRNYSSGMYVRLGFSVAVHTEPEILLVDEVLAVGDAAFQRKCLDRIEQLQREGVSILFVSHSLDIVEKVCERCIWMDEGRIRADDTAEAVIAQYTWHSHVEDAAELTEGSKRRWGSGGVTIEQVSFEDASGRERKVFFTGEPLVVKICYHASRPIQRPVFGLAIHHSNGAHITGPNTQFAGYEISSIEGEGIIKYTVPSLPLLQGTYYLSVAVHDWEDLQMYDYHDRLYAFQVFRKGEERYGLITLKGDWSQVGPSGVVSGSD
jgi:lipopolysaccharide transport system ATP-binding protein